MKTTVTPLQDNQVRLEVEVPAEELGSSLDRAARELSKSVSLKGFRRGKVPRKILERHVGRDAILQEAVRFAVPEFLARAVEAEEIDLVGRPEVESVDTNPDGPLAFGAVVDLRPVVEMCDPSEVSVQLESSLVVEEEEIQKEIDALRERFADLTAVPRGARKGDYVLINLEVTALDGKVESLSRPDFHYEVGSGSVVEELDTELEGKRAGEILQFRADLPESLPDHGGERGSFSVLVKEVKEKELPALDDEWVGSSSEFDTVAELEEEVRSAIGRVKRMQSRREAEEKALEALTERVGLVPPPSVVTEEVELRVENLSRQLEGSGLHFEDFLEKSGQSLDEIKESYRPDAAKAVSAVFLLRALADYEGISVTEEEIDEEIATLAQQTGEKPDKVRRKLAKTGRLQSIESGMLRRKTLSCLVGKVALVDSTGASVDLSVDTDEEDLVS